MSHKLVTAIDVGSSKIATVIASVSDDDNQPNVMGIHSYPSKGIKRGVVVNIDEAMDAISESLTAAERMAGVTSSDIFLTINGEHIVSINNKGVVAVVGNEITREDTERAIDNARTLTLPDNYDPIYIIPREYVVDNQGGIKYPVGMTGSRLEVETHIVTAPSSTAMNLKKCVEGLGLNVFNIMFTGIVSSIAVLTDTEKELGVTMLDIGAGTVSITIFQEGSIAFSGTVPLGGLNITSDLAIGLQLDLEDAEKLKLNLDKIFSEKQPVNTPDGNIPALLRKKEPEETKKGTKEDLVDLSIIGLDKYEKVSKELIKKIITARLEEIFDLVKAQVSKSGFDVASPAGIVLTGGSAQLFDINKYAREYFGSPVRIGYPKGLKGMVEEIKSPAYSALYGLTIFGAEAINYAIPMSKSSDNPISGVFAKIFDFLKSLKP